MHCLWELPECITMMSPCQPQGQRDAVRLTNGCNSQDEGTETASRSSASCLPCLCVLVATDICQWFTQAEGARSA